MQCNLGSEIAQNSLRMGHRVAIYSIILLGMPFIEWCRVNPDVQRIQNIYYKGGEGVFKAEIQPDEVEPCFQKFLDTIAVSKN